MRALIIIPAYNEEKSIVNVIEGVTRLVPSADVLVIDDCSTDNTFAVASKTGVRVLRHKFNQGVMSAEATGLRYAAAHDYDLVVRMDGDGQHDPFWFATLRNEILNGADLVIGTRFGVDATYKPKGLRLLGSWILSKLVSHRTKKQFTDPTSGFRAFNKAAIKFLAPCCLTSEPESIVAASAFGFDVQEVYVDMYPRLHGRSSLTFWRSIVYMYRTVSILLFD